MFDVLFVTDVYNVKNANIYNNIKNSKMYVCKLSNENCVYMYKKKHITINTNVLEELNIDVIIINVGFKLTECINKYINNLQFTKYTIIFSNISLNINNKLVEVKTNTKLLYISKYLSNFNENSCMSNETNTIEKYKHNYNLKPNFKKFINICKKYLQYIPDTSTKRITKDNLFEAVYIEFRILDHSEAIVKNCINMLDEQWSHTIVCGNDNCEQMYNICEKINNGIKIIKLDMNNVTYNDYNNLLLTKEFWNMFKGEKILLYQSDSLILKHNIGDFLNYDFVGAPFNKNSKVILGMEQVGNGGLSLRSKSTMIEILNNKDRCDTQYSNVSLSHKITNKLDNILEDIFFCQNMQNLKIGDVANYDVARRFCMDTIFNEDAFAMHAMWHGCPNWEEFVSGYFSKMTQTNRESNDHGLIFKKITSKRTPCDQTCSCINEKLINFTRYMFSEPLDFLINKKTIDVTLFDDFVIIVDFFNLGGGTTNFINLIVSKYKYYNNFIIIRENKNKYTVTLNDDYIVFSSVKFKDIESFIFKRMCNIDFIFVNHFYEVDTNFVDFIFSLKKYDKKIITITHDFFYFYNKVQPSFEELTNLPPCNKSYTNNFDLILTQHRNNLQYFNNKNIKIVTMPDYKYSEKQIYNTDNIKTVGIIGNISILKGLNFLKTIVCQHKDIKFIVFGIANINTNEFPNITICSYTNIQELNTLLVLHKPTVLLELSIWPETYSYTLTLAHIVKLPLIVYSKPVSCVIYERIKELNINHVTFDTLQQFNTIIHSNIHKYTFFTIQPVVYFSKYIDELFIKNYNEKSIIKKNKLRLIPSFIYFPQFHTIPENNVNFYNNYTDIINLNNLRINNYVNELLTPNLDYFNLDFIENYDLKNNKSIIRKQLNIVNQLDSTIACYYYWFNKNSITNKNMVMSDVVNNLFLECNTIGTKIFFIWANEDWSNNPAFSTTNTCISNDYNKDTFTANIKNLLFYFNQPCYLKKNNKPLIMIYHTWKISINKLDILYDVFNTECLLNGYDGCEIYLNNMYNIDGLDTYKFKTFKINFNYKLNNGYRYIHDNQAVIDFEKYIEQVTEKCIDNDVQTIALDFNNHARLCKPNKIHLSTVCIKNYHFLKVKFIQNLLLRYVDVNTENIILINSLNEWGEKMAFEPSNELGFYYINLIKKYLK
jgi:hypothetical protein